MWKVVVAAGQHLLSGHERCGWSPLLASNCTVQLEGVRLCGVDVATVEGQGTWCEDDNTGKKSTLDQVAGYDSDLMLQRKNCRRQIN